MTTLSGPVKQSLSEKRTHVFDYTLDLLGGVTLSSATAVLTKPDGTTQSLSGSVNGVLVSVTVGPLAAVGQYYLDCNAVCSDTEILNVRLIIEVGY